MPHHEPHPGRSLGTGPAVAQRGRGSDNAAMTLAPMSNDTDPRTGCPRAPTAPAVGSPQAGTAHREADRDGASRSAFDRMIDYVALPRLSGLAIAPDGASLVTSVSGLSPDTKTYTSSLWRLDAQGASAPVRLTRGATSESGATFLPDGRILFTTKRKDPDDPEATEDSAAVWALPAGGGEAYLVATRPGGIDAMAAARGTGEVVVAADTLPGDDAERRKARKNAGVSAVLHESYPVRLWDHDLGPGTGRLFALGVPPDDAAADPAELLAWPAGRLQEHALSDDGTLIACTVQVPVDGQPGAIRTEIVVSDASSGEVRVRIGEDDAEFDSQAFGPDGGSLVCVRSTRSSFDGPGVPSVWLVDLATGAGRNPAPALPLWPTGPVFAPDGKAVFFVADEQGRAPIFRLDIDSGAITRLTAAGAHSDVVAAPDGSAVFALRSDYDAPPHPVRIDPRTADQDGVALPAPGAVGPLPGTLVEVSTQADDGVPIRSWLVLPEGAGAGAPAPLVLWIHGGPLSSWNAWSWRWNPWLLAAKGYAVLLPDPALSTGYGLDFVVRGWGSWGERPYTDLMAATDAACARDDIDASRTAAMGGSFGGYMANWAATHTDRFDAIVTHASLWALDQFSGTTDASFYWQREFGDPLTEPGRYDANSPHRYADAIDTPMLVVHGDRDYRVPIGEGLRLWWDLSRRSVDAKFLYFPDENHWVLTPGNAQVWYETVFAFLAQHVLGQEWVRPDLV